MPCDSTRFAPGDGTALGEALQRANEIGVATVPHNVSTTTWWLDEMTTSVTVSDDHGAPVEIGDLAALGGCRDADFRAFVAALAANEREIEELAKVEEGSPLWARDEDAADATAIGTSAGAQRLAPPPKLRPSTGKE